MATTVFVDVPVATWTQIAAAGESFSVCNTLKAPIEFALSVAQPSSTSVQRYHTLLPGDHLVRGDLDGNVWIRWGKLANANPTSDSHSFAVIK